MKKERFQKDSENPSPQAILALTIHEAQILEDRAKIAKYRNDAQNRHNFLTERAQLVTTVGQKIEEATKKGYAFPKEELDNLRELAKKAREAMDHDYSFALADLLTDHDSKGPNLLEQIAKRVYPEA